LVKICLKFKSPSLLSKKTSKYYYLKYLFKDVNNNSYKLKNKAVFKINERQEIMA